MKIKILSGLQQLRKMNPKKDELRLFLNSDEDKAAFFDNHSDGYKC